MLRYLAVALLVFPLLAAKNKHIGPPTTSNDVVQITATPITDQQEVKNLLGYDPGFPLVILKVNISPKGNNKIRLDRDDFTLLWVKDGERSQPMEPGQIAGKGAIRVRSVNVTGTSSVGGGQGGPIWGGGVPGVGPVMGPEPLGSGTMGNTASVTEAQAKMEDGKTEKDNPLLKVLKEKILPNKDKTDEDTSGLLYFMFDGNKPPKPKDLSLMYKSTDGRLVIDFK